MALKIEEVLRTEKKLWRNIHLDGNSGRILLSWQPSPSRHGGFSLMAVPRRYSKLPWRWTASLELCSIWTMVDPVGRLKTSSNMPHKKARLLVLCFHSYY
jgi:hypothetical protein